MQIASNGNNLCEMSNPVFWENKKNIISLSSAESAQRVVKDEHFNPLKTE